MTRMARGLGALRQLLKQALIPEGDNKAVQYALRYAPDALYAGMAALNAPEGVDLGTRLGIAAEDLALGLGGSVLGQTSGLGAARLVRGKKLGPDARNIAASLGDVVVTAPLVSYAPRPILDSAIEKAYKRETDRQAASEEQQQRTQDEQLINLLLGTGAVGGALLGSGTPVRMV